MPTRPKGLAERMSSLKRSKRRASTLARKLSGEHADIDAMRGSNRWKRLRSIIRNRDPLCRDPFNAHRDTGIIKITKQIHHIVPAADDPELFFDENNLAGVCTKCHGRIDAMEKKGMDATHLFQKMPVKPATKGEGG